MMSPKNDGKNILLTIQMLIFYYLIKDIVKICGGKENLIFLSVNAVPDVTKQDCVTQTVYGFLDFTTTIGNTVMVFSPKSTASQETSSYIPNTHIETKLNTIMTQIQDINPSKTMKETTINKPIMTTALEIIQGSTSTTTNIPKPSKLLSKVEIITSFKESTKIDKKETLYSQNENEQVIPIGNILDEPEYDFLSRQPSEFVEETFKVMNLKSSVNAQTRTRSSTNNKKSDNVKVKSNFPTGLVTKVSGTVIKDGATTVHETSVIGTYISGKYAQVLQSSSHVFKYNKPKISTTPTLKVLKTTPPNILLNNRHRVETKVEDQENIRSTRRPTTIGNFKKGFRNQSKEDDYSKKVETLTTSVEHAVTKAPRRVKPKSRRNKNSRNALNNRSTSTINTLLTDSSTRRNFKPKHQHSAIEISPSEQTSLYKFKLNRTPGRWQYKTTTKPKIAIRKSFNPGDDQNKLASALLTNSDITTNDISKRNYNSTSEETDLESSGSISGAVFNDVETGNGKVIEEIDRKYPIETLNVEISTAADLKDKYYEIATIKTPYLFQVGTVKRTRYITVTSTYEKTFEPEVTSTLAPNEPLTENILASSSQIDREQNILESSVATLAPLYLSSNEETPPIETRVESFSTTQVLLKTNILPIIRDETNTTSITLIQTYRITRYVTATKTLPPIEAYEFVPSQRLKEFNSKLDEAGSELNIELDFGDENSEDGSRIRQILPDSDIKEIGSDFDLIESKPIQAPTPRITQKVAEASRNHVSGEQLQQLALLGLLNPGNDNLQQYIPTPKPVLKLETVYKTEIIPIFNGHSTSFSTISRPITTIQKTEYELPTSTFPQLQIPQQLNPFAPQQYQLTTAPIISQTVITQTLSKILKLTFGAKTAYTTLFSTNVIPTILTTYVTTSVQVHPTAGIPGYYPSPFAPYPFIG